MTDALDILDMGIEVEVEVEVATEVIVEAEVVPQTIKGN